jgi:beta-galactosidase
LPHQFLKNYDWENVNTDPGLIQLITPADQWKRKLFNDLARVIVQTTKEAGNIALTAISPKLTNGVMNLQSTATKVRPAVK